MNRTNKRKQDTVLYHVKAILKIAWQNIDMFLDWGGGLIQSALDKHKHNKMVRYKYKSEKYFQELREE